MSEPTPLPGPRGIVPGERLNVTLPVCLWDSLAGMPPVLAVVLLYLCRHSYGSGDPAGLLTTGEICAGRLVFPDCPRGLRWDAGTGLPRWRVEAALQQLHEAHLVTAYDLWDTDPRAAVCREAGVPPQAFGVNWATLLDKG